MAQYIKSKEEFETFTAQTDKTLLVDFYADWCMPCQMLSPVLEQMEKESAGKIQLAKVNVDECLELAMAFKVSSIPAVVIYKEGKLYNRFVGAMPREEIEKLL